MRKILGCFIFIMIMITSQIFVGTIYYVDATNGSDYNPGTEIYPWKTIQKAANTMIAGDKVIVRTGTYDERITGNTSGNRGSLITFQVNSGDIVNCYGFTLTGDYIKIQNIGKSKRTKALFPSQIQLTTLKMPLPDQEWFFIKKSITK